MGLLPDKPIFKSLTVWGGIVWTVVELLVANGVVGGTTAAVLEKAGPILMLLGLRRAMVSPTK